MRGVWVQEGMPVSWQREKRAHVVCHRAAPRRYFSGLSGEPALIWMYWQRQSRNLFSDSMKFWRDYFVRKSCFLFIESFFFQLLLKQCSWTKIASRNSALCFEPWINLQSNWLCYLIIWEIDIPMMFSIAVYFIQGNGCVEITQMCMMSSFWLHKFYFYSI